MLLIFLGSGMAPAIRSALVQRGARDGERATVASAAGAVDMIGKTAGLPLAAWLYGALPAPGHGGRPRRRGAPRVGARGAAGGAPRASRRLGGGRLRERHALRERRAPPRGGRPPRGRGVSCAAARITPASTS